MPKVFIPNKGGHDFSDALRYGELVYVTSGYINKFAIATMAREWMNSFDIHNVSSEDYILFSALPTLNSIGCALFAHKFGRLNILLYRNGKYIQRTILLDELMNGGLEDE